MHIAHCMQATYCYPGLCHHFVNPPVLSDWPLFVVLVNTSESLLFRKIVFRSFFTQLHLLFHQPILVSIHFFQFSMSLGRKHQRIFGG
jgi:hypothetical protein